MTASPSGRLQSRDTESGERARWRKNESKNPCAARDIRTTTRIDQWYPAPEDKTRAPAPKPTGGSSKHPTLPWCLYGAIDCLIAVPLEVRQTSDAKRLKKILLQTEFYNYGQGFSVAPRSARRRPSSRKTDGRWSDAIASRFEN